MGDFVVVKRESENFTKKRNIFVILMILILVNILHVFNEILHIQKKKSLNLVFMVKFLPVLQTLVRLRFEDSESNIWTMSEYSTFRAGAIVQTDRRANTAHTHTLLVTSHHSHWVRAYVLQKR